jgi:hypothetical protein
MAADMAGDAGDRTGSGGGCLRLGSVPALVWLGPVWPAARDPPGSDVAKCACRIVCTRKNPMGLQATQGCSTDCLKESGSSAKSCHRRGWIAAGQQAP